MKKTISLLCALFMVFSSVSVPVKAEEEIETENPVEEVQEIEEQEQKETEEEVQASSDEKEDRSESEVIPEETEKQEEVAPVEEEKQEEKEEEPAEEITEEEVGEDAELLNGTYGDLTYEISDGKVTITDCDQSATAVDIPAEIEGYPVTSIGESAFSYCSSLTSITIPDSVTSIGAYAFQNCSGLSSVTIPGSVKNIGNIYKYEFGLFEGCPLLKTVGSVGGGYNIEFGWKTAIPDNSFADCTNITSVTIPEGIESIGNGSFRGCSSLIDIIMPASVSYIGDNAFYKCSQITQIKIPDQVKTIESGQFAFCTNLSQVVMPASLTKIADIAFRDCHAIKHIDLPVSISEIGYAAFWNCQNLEEIVIPEGIKTIETMTFECCENLTEVQLPKSLEVVGPGAFGSCDKLQTVFYNGTEDEWNKTEIMDINDPLLNAKFIFEAIRYENVTNFVKRLYALCFERKADASGLKGWIDRLKSGRSTAAQVVQAFFTSKEMQNLKLSNEEFVERCYQVMMGRASDAGGKKSWVEKLDAGMSVTYVLRGFVGSTEFDKICKQYGITRGSINVTEPRDQNYGITAFVSRCYSEVLGRKADVNGLNGWVKFILGSSNRKSTATLVASTGFFNSDEYLNKKTTNDQYVNTLYRTFLGREADQGGYNYWMNKLSSGTSRDSVMKGFANSAEFAKIMAKYGIK